MATGVINPRVKAVTARDDCRLEITFTNGEAGVFDCTHLLSFGVFKEFQDINYFRQVRVEGGTVVWPHQQDICPDTLYEDSEKVMTESQANQIASLLNAQNQLTTKYDSARIIKDQANFVIHADNNGDVLGAAEVTRVQWYQAELKHLTVDPRHQRKGIGRQLLRDGEKRALSMGARICQCTVREDNTPSIKLFLSSGYQRTVVFLNTETGKRVMVLQKVIQGSR